MGQNAKLVWSGTQQVQAKMERYGKAVEDSVYSLAQYYAPQIESDAKLNARWKDRTGNARQSMKARVVCAKGKVIIYLFHGMKYGIYLELANAGRFAIIWRTLSSFFPKINESLQRIFNR